MERETESHPPWETILQDCLKGDQKAYKAVYDAYSQAMFSIAMRMLNNREEAEEILQDAFITAFAGLKQLQDVDSFGSWLKKITINRSLDQLRKRKITFETVNDIDIAEEDEKPEAERPYTVEIILEALQELNDAYRVVFTLHLFEDYSDRMISEKLGISESNSKAILFRAKRKLIGILNQTALS
jgi:RNA polymerase sigma-70 factor (ECF subfamily)